MKKIPTLYERDPDTNLRYVKEVIHQDNLWVFSESDQVTPTFKWDGTAVMNDGSVWWKRRQVKPGMVEPENWVQTGDADPDTGKRVGWIPLDPAANEDALFWETLQHEIQVFGPPTPGTYELVGPAVNANRHKMPHHHLIRHGDGVFPARPPVDFLSLGAWLHYMDQLGSVVLLHGGERKNVPGLEGIVWHHPDGRMAKIKVTDFPR